MFTHTIKNSLPLNVSDSTELISIDVMCEHEICCHINCINEHEILIIVKTGIV